MVKKVNTQSVVTSKANSGITTKSSQLSTRSTKVKKVASTAPLGVSTRQQNTTSSNTKRFTRSCRAVPSIQLEKYPSMIINTRSNEQEESNSIAVQITKEIKEKTKTRAAKKQQAASFVALNTVVVDPVSPTLPKDEDHPVVEVIQVFKKRVERQK